MNTTSLTILRTLPLRARQAGMNLIEMLVALVIGMVLLLAISVLVLQQTSSRSEVAKSNRQVENGRYALQILNDDVRHAGFWGEYSPPLTNTTYLTDDPTAPAIGLATCAAPANAPTNLGWVTAAAPTLPVAVFGYPAATSNSSLALAAPCLPAADRRPGSSVLVVRRVATTTVAAPAAVAGTSYLQISQCADDPATTPFVLSTVAADFVLRQKNCTALAPIRKYIVRIYFVSNCHDYATGQTQCTAAADNGSPVPTLKMVEFIDGAQTLIPLVEGIENLQIDYGIDSSDSNGAPNTYVSSPSALQWPNVVAVKVNLLARNIEPTKAYVDAKTYTLGAAGAIDPCASNPFGGAFSGAQITTCKAFQRHVYSELIRVENVSGRREQP